MEAGSSVAHLPSCVDDDDDALLSETLRLCAGGDWSVSLAIAEAALALEGEGLVASGAKARWAAIAGVSCYRLRRFRQALDYLHEAQLPISRGGDAARPMDDFPVSVTSVDRMIAACQRCCAYRAATGGVTAACVSPRRPNTLRRAMSLLTFVLALFVLGTILAHWRSVGLSPTHPADEEVAVLEAVPPCHEVTQRIARCLADCEQRVVNASDLTAYLAAWLTLMPIPV